MDLRLGYDIQFHLPEPISMLAVLYVHPSLASKLLEPDEIAVEPALSVREYIDGFGNRVGRLAAPAGALRLSGSTLIQDSGHPDEVDWSARLQPVEELPDDALQFLLASRFCQVDQLSATALDLFGSFSPGWPLVQAICDWVHHRITFDYRNTRPTKTALDVYTERTGVCRDFQHLAITFCRALNVPARYATGYLPDIGVPLKPPMDFSAWFEVYLDGRWWAFDARNNEPRIGRTLMARGRDASDVALTTSFGRADLTGFTVVCEEEPSHD